MSIERKLETARVLTIAPSALPGMLFTLAIAVVSFGLWRALQGTWLNLSALLWAFVLSIVISNLVPQSSESRFATGAQWSSSSLLRIAVAFLGLTISASLWTQVGAVSVLAVLLNLGLAYVLGSLFCRYVLKMNGRMALLIGVGTGICGASAIAAAGPALRAKAEEMGVSVAVITLFGLLAMFGYPLLFQYALGTWLANEPAAFGMWSGMGIHETAQVVAAGSQVDNALDVAMMAKSIRIFMIGPVVLGSLFLARTLSSSEDGQKQGIATPWFAVAFIALTFVHWGLRDVLPGWTAISKDYVKPGVTFLLAWAFAGVGYRVKLASIRRIGMKVFIGGLTVALMAGISALLITKYVWLALR